MKKSKLGVQLYTVRQFTKTKNELAQTLKKLADIGYEAVELYALGTATPKEIARLVEDCGLKVAATHVEWNRFLKEIDKVVDEHKMWGCSHAGISWLPAKYYSLDGLRSFINELTPVAEQLEKEGIDFSYHNHNHELMRYGQKTWLEMLFEQAPPTILKAEIDVFWIQAGGGDPTFWIRKCAGREPLLHLKDMRISGPWWNHEQQYAEIGEGNLNWQAILRTAKESDVEFYIVEQDQCYERNPFDSVSISYSNLKAMGLN